MAKYDVYALRSDGGYVLDCQSDLVDQFETRLVVPLIRADEPVTPVHRLTPAFDIGGERYIMATQLAAAVPKREFGPAIVSLADQDIAIDAALDVLITGF